MSECASRSTLSRCRFNGAATTSSRNAERRFTNASVFYGFNGAATISSRNAAILKQIAWSPGLVSTEPRQSRRGMATEAEFRLAQIDALQRSRDNLVAECQVIAEAPPMLRMLQRSRDDLVAEWRAMRAEPRNARSFNGAATISSRNAGHLFFRRAGRDLLQRSRDNHAAECPRRLAWR